MTFDKEGKSKLVAILNETIKVKLEGCQDKIIAESQKLIDVIKTLILDDRFDDKEIMDDMDSISGEKLSDLYKRTYRHCLKAAFRCIIYDRDKVIQGIIDSPPADDSMICGTMAACTVGVIDSQICCGDAIVMDVDCMRGDKRSAMALDVEGDGSSKKRRNGCS